MARHERARNPESSGFLASRMELTGFEPVTFCMPCRRAPSCATAPLIVLSLQLVSSFVSNARARVKTRRPTHKLHRAISTRRLREFAAGQPADASDLPSSQAGGFRPRLAGFFDKPSLFDHQIRIEPMVNPGKTEDISPKGLARRVVRFTRRFAARRCSCSSGRRAVGPARRLPRPCRRRDKTACSRCRSCREELTDETRGDGASRPAWR